MRNTDDRARRGGSAVSDRRTSEFPEVLRLAWSEARALNHHWVGLEHLLLAFAQLMEDESSDVGRLLVEAGASAASIRSAVEEDHPRGSRPLQKRFPTGWDELQQTPALFRIAGRAEGITIGLGQHTVDDTSVLLALLWEPVHRSVLMRGALDTEAVLRTLTERGVALPPGEPPPTIEDRWGEPVCVPLEDLEAILRRLPHRMPEGTTFCFNYNDERARIKATEGVDLATLIEALIGDARPG
jgi:hypothetical protein